MVLSWVIAFLDRQIIGILIEPLRRDLALSDTQISLIQGGAFAFFFVFAGLPIGRLVDRTNRRTILFAGMLLWSGMTIACGCADRFWELFLARIGVGVGEACLAPASMSIIADVIPPPRRGLAMGLMIGATAVGSAVSVLLGGLVLQAYGARAAYVVPLIGALTSWQMVFFLVGIPGLILSLLLLTIAEPARRERAPSGSKPSFTAYLNRYRSAFAFTYAAFVANAVFGYVVSAWIAVILLRIDKMAPGRLGISMALILLICGPIGPTFSGMLGDRLARTRPESGRLLITQIIYPIQMVLTGLWWWFPGADASLAFFALSSPLLSAMISASCYPALGQLAPNELRGQAIAVFALIANLAGLGIGPTAVALITDYGFHDPARVKESVILVALPVAGIGLLSATLARRPFRSAVSGAAGSAGASLSRSGRTNRMELAAH